MNVLAPAPSRCATVAITAVPSTTLPGSRPTSRTTRRIKRIEEAGVVHHAEVDDREREKRGGRGHAADAVHRERAQLRRKPAGERRGDRHQRQRDEHRGDAKEDQREQDGDGREAEPGQHRDGSRRRSAHEVGGRARRSARSRADVGSTDAR